jgi:hypothetical protein
MTQSASSQPIIFVSYAHADEPATPRAEEVRWLTFVMSYLRPAVKNAAYTLWVDGDMPGGAEWESEIEGKLRACDIFVLLVSTHSMGSDYVIRKELALIEERRRNGEPVHVYPLVLEPTSEASLAPIRAFKRRPRDGHPLSGFPLHERKQQMADAADEIAGIAAKIAESKAAAPAPPTPKQAFADLGRLPGTPYRRLVGREAILQLLDEAWAGSGAAIVSLIAEGGAGKSALLNEWLLRLQADGYRGANPVLGWSFYSQGSKTRATAADPFLDWAARALGVEADAPSAAARGRVIAQALSTRRALLVLDGVEPLQHGPGAQAGLLKDPGLRELLRSLAMAAPSPGQGLIVLTSRAAVADILGWRGSRAPVIDVDKLTDEAGAEVLRENGVWGTDAELKKVAREFGGHPLALSLLASFLSETQNGDARRRDHIRGVLADSDAPLHEHARRVMQSYETEWLASRPDLLAILEFVGLFDRPASADCLKALRARPPIAGLTDAIVKLDDIAWRRRVARLREVRLLSPADPGAPEGLDAHPLVREWFGERLRLSNEAAWRAAHSRLFDHLRRSAHEGKEPSLADLAPLYQAVGHGCQAGRHRQALGKIYLPRISRGYAEGVASSYSHHALGAAASNLAAISWFFESPYKTPIASLGPRMRGNVLHEAAVALNAQGRTREAAEAIRAALRQKQNREEMEAEARVEAGRPDLRAALAKVDRANVATASSTRVTIELLLGDLAAAATAAADSLRLGREIETPIRGYRLARQANVTWISGDRTKARAAFAEADRLAATVRPPLDCLIEESGYHLCDFLIAEGRAADVRARAFKNAQMLWAFGILAEGLAELAAARAELDMALRAASAEESGSAGSEHAREIGQGFEKAIERLRASGRNDQFPRGFIARAAFRRTIGDFAGAARDLDEAEEIAAPGPMRLYLLDLELERARVALARREAFAPLDGLTGTSPPAPHDITAEALGNEARRGLEAARTLIVDFGYRWRDEDLAELDAVLARARRFADLPPRV